MALRPLHFCEVLEEEHSALYGHEDWRVLPSDIISISDVLTRCREVFGDALFEPVEEVVGIEEQKVKLAAILTEKFVDTSSLLIEDARLGEALPLMVTMLAGESSDDTSDPHDDEDPSQLYEPDKIRWRNRETLEALLDGLLVHERRTWYFEKQQIRGPRSVAARWREVFGSHCVWAQEQSTVDPAERVGDIVCDLNRLVDGPILTSVPVLRDVRDYLSDELLTLLASDQTFSAEDLQHLNRRVLDDVFGDAVQSGPEARLAKQIEIIHANGNTSALCLSGGGIRSATFGLGVLQGLAKRNLLDKFDYISTVSGGGYIGGWLSSWSRRHPTGMRGVSSDLAAAPTDKLSPDPAPVRHLREFSNYLTPRVGALTGDTLTVVAIYIRNLLLNWVVLVPMLIAALLIPRLVFAIDFGDLSADVVTTAKAMANGLQGRDWLGIGSFLTQVSSTLDASLRAVKIGSGARAWYWTAIVFLAVSFAYLGFARPAGNKYRGRRHLLSYAGIVPLVVAAIALTAAWARHTSVPGAKPGTPWPELLVIGAIPFLSAIVYGIHFATTSAASRRETLFGQLRGLLTPGLRFRVELRALVIAASITVAMLALIAGFIFPSPSQTMEFDTFPSPIMAFSEHAPVASLYVVFAVPLVLGVFFVCGAIFVGMASQVNQDYDREWWARCSGLTFAAIVGWVVLTATVVFGPLLIHFAPILAATVGGASGIASYVLGRYRAAAERKKTGSSQAFGTALSLVAPVFVFALLAFLAAGTSRIFPPKVKVTEGTATVLKNVTWQSEQKHDAAQAAALGSQFRGQNMALREQPRVPMFAGGALEVKTSTPARPLISVERLSAWNHLRSFEDTNFGAVMLLVIGLLTVTALSSRFVNANKFSMHSMYRNRLIRAYLGASRLQRDPNPVTGFDPQDDLPMHFLRPEFLWVASFRDARAFFDQLDTDMKPFVQRLRDEVYTTRKRKDLLDDRAGEDFAAELAQVINYVIETVDLRAEPKPPVVHASELAAAWRSQFSSDMRWLFGNIRNLRWTRRPQPIRSTWSHARQYVVERSRAVTRDFVRRTAWLEKLTGRRLFSAALEDAPRPRPSFAVLRRNRKDLDAAFPSTLHPYDQPIVRPPDLRDVERLRQIVTKPRRAPSTFGERLYVALGDDASILPKLSHSNAHLREAIDVFVRALNIILERFDLEWETATGFERVSCYPPSSKVFRKNRYILDRNLIGAIHPLRSPRPMHIVNMALNLVRGQNLAWQERKAESFTTSPMHSGSYMLGYRDSSRYGDPSGITLGTAVAISGAAITPNRGQKTSTPLAFLMTLFNVRLGWWLGNPGVQGQHTWTAEGPTPSTRPLIAEASGDTNDRFPYVYLSDGGHFENLGLYEMVLRRRHYIVISDATCDRSYAFDDLGNAIRKIRTDLGIPIDIDKMYIYPKGSEKLGKYCALGKIRYSRVDANGKDGLLLYIKPGVYMNEPRDIYNYSKMNDEFPHETTIDQWFGESQFESYRMLGSHILDQICHGEAGTAPDDDPRTVEARNWCAKSMEDFFDRALEYLGDKTQPVLSAPRRGRLSRRETEVSLLTGRFLQLYEKDVPGSAPRPHP
ncbi:MAG TPA: patatin-like phospholipase family protein [Thermoanaerobaculia bacterium]|nr:patatin-like phospholipase family protein [Thermoanaerobaculia bacterium]